MTLYVTQNDVILTGNCTKLYLEQVISNKLSQFSEPELYGSGSVHFPLLSPIRFD